MKGERRGCWYKIDVSLLIVGLLILNIAVCILMTTLVGCKIDPIWDFDEIPDLGIQTIQDAMWWVADEICYVSDDIHYPADEYWQSPAQTYVWRCGDCEDYCILVLYLIHRDVGIDGQMCGGYFYDNRHAWVYVDDHYWEPQGGWIVDDNPNYSLSYSIGYDEVIRRSTTTHKRLDID